jgi:hypothetical protein
VSGTVTWGDALWLARHRTPNDRLRFWGSAVSSAITAAVLCTDISAAMAVVPNVVTASWWPPLLAVGSVTAGAAAAAARSVRHLDHPSHRRPSLARFVAGRVAPRTARPDLLLALRRIADEPRTTTRPALLLGLAAVVATASTWLNRQARFVIGEEQWTADDYYSQAYNLVWLATAVGIGLCALGLVVALSDAVVRRRRTDAAAVAAGGTRDHAASRAQHSRPSCPPFPPSSSGSPSAGRPQWPSPVGHGATGSGTQLPTALSSPSRGGSGPSGESP